MGSTFDMDVAARTLCQEARGEPLDGQQAVAHVIKNRLASGRWGHSLSSVCLWRAQFSGWYSLRGTPAVADPNFAYACGLPDNDATLSHMKSVMQVAMDNETDMMAGAMFYYANSIPPPAWVDETQFCGQWGHQRFYRGTK